MKQKLTDGQQLFSLSDAAWISCYEADQLLEVLDSKTAKNALRDFWSASPVEKAYFFSAGQNTHRNALFFPLLSVSNEPLPARHLEGIGYGPPTKHLTKYLSPKYIEALKNLMTHFPLLEEEALKIGVTLRTKSLPFAVSFLEKSDELRVEKFGGADIQKQSAFVLFDPASEKFCRLYSTEYSDMRLETHMSDATLFSDYEKAKKELSVLQKNEPIIHTNIEIVAIELTIKAPELIKSESLLMREAQTLSSRDDLEKNTKKSAVLSPLKKL